MRYTLRYSGFHGGRKIGYCKSIEAAIKRSRSLQGDCACPGCVEIVPGGDDEPGLSPWSYFCDQILLSAPVRR